MQNRIESMLRNVDKETAVLWAADCAWHVLKTFECCRSGDLRPRRAIEAAWAWRLGKTTVAAVRKTAFAAHAAARAAATPAATAAARACAHAAATVHVAAHACHAARYARKAMLSGQDVLEARWQEMHLARLTTQDNL